jgi:hypothetical protein
MTKLESITHQARLEMLQRIDLELVGRLEIRLGRVPTWEEIGRGLSQTVDRQNCARYWWHGELLLLVTAPRMAPNPESGMMELQWEMGPGPSCSVG